MPRYSFRITKPKERGLEGSLLPPCLVGSRPVSSSVNLRVDLHGYEDQGPLARVDLGWIRCKSPETKHAARTPDLDGHQCI